MPVAEVILEKLRNLPLDKQQAALEFAEALPEAAVAPSEARAMLDRIRLDVERRHGTLSVILPLLREARES